MNDHLISRSRFLDALVLDADNKTDLIQVHHALEKAVISPDEVRGVASWIPHGDCGVTECSACKWSIEEYVEYNYCPNCGARMKGVSEE